MRSVIAALFALLFLAGTMSANASASTTVSGTLSSTLFEDCFASDPGAGSTNKIEHANWARRQSTGTLIGNLQGKIAMVFNCTAVSNDQAISAFGAASGVVARRISEPARAADQNCFGNDRGSRNPDDAVHIGWARTQSRATYRDNLIWKVGVALRCLKAGEPQVELFAEISTILARTPVGATPASAGDCSGRVYSLAGVAPVRVGQQVTVNWSAPANHSATDWIGIFPEGQVPGSSGVLLDWRYVPKGPCGYVYINAPSKPGRYYVYYLENNSYKPIGGGRLLVVNP